MSIAKLAPAAELPKLPPAPGGGFPSRGPTADENEAERRTLLAGSHGSGGRLYAALGAAAGP